MRRRIILLIISVCLLIIALQLGGEEYKPLYKLGSQNIEKISISMPEAGNITITGEEDIAALADELSDISVRYTGSPDACPLAEITVTLWRERDMLINIYTEALSIDGRLYHMEPEESAVIAEKIKALF